MATAQLGFTDRKVPIPSHVCLFYYDDDELRERLGFVRAGLENPDEAVVLFGRPERLEQVQSYIASDLGRDVAADRASGKLVLIGGDRDPQRLLAGIGEALDKLTKRDVRLIRFMGFIGWFDAEWPSPQELLAFESRVNEAAMQFPAIVMCTYNAADLPGPVLMLGGVATHPLTVVGTTLCENPHYVPTGEYLAKLADLAGRPWYEGVRVGPLVPARTKAVASSRAR